MFISETKVLFVNQSYVFETKEIILEKIANLRIFSLQLKALYTIFFIRMGITCSTQIDIKWYTIINWTDINWTGEQKKNNKKDMKNVLKNRALCASNMVLIQFKNEPHIFAHVAVVFIAPFFNGSFIWLMNLVKKSNFYHFSIIFLQLNRCHGLDRLIVRKKIRFTTVFFQFIHSVYFK